MPRFIVSDIMWDTDDDVVDLPESLEVVAEDKSEALDAVSDKSGYLIFMANVKEVTEK